MKKAPAYISIFFLVVFAGKTRIISAQEKDYKAYTLFLYNFMKYIEWPTQEGDFILGVVGDSPIHKELITLSENKKAKGKNIVVKIINTPDEAIGCSMLYIPSSKSALIKAYSEKVEGKSVLIVAEKEGLARKGAAISFSVDEDDTLRFDFNKSVLDKQGLKIANVLIQLGMIVG